MQLVSFDSFFSSYNQACWQQFLKQRIQVSFQLSSSDFILSQNRIKYCLRITALPEQLPNTRTDFIQTEGDFTFQIKKSSLATDFLGEESDDPGSEQPEILFTSLNGAR
ncbi:hypothetical protein [Solemya elarraichensis gill symbiont]|uniref:Uncharacterized protein n=1 Tax=Solemya elarraichensis gill symbiont TaxID=1918949 RepID=A0A1T2KYV5_9GAMM|nr:hypothetical protein BOW52_09560 [Solemya elarraichensis gill symbiont]